MHLLQVAKPATALGDEPALVIEQLGGELDYLNTQLLTVRQASRLAIAFDLPMATARTIAGLCFDGGAER